jgi:hypothetical protein
MAVGVDRDEAVGVDSDVENSPKPSPIDDVVVLRPKRRTGSRPLEGASERVGVAGERERSGGGVPLPPVRVAKPSTGDRRPRGEAGCNPSKLCSGANVLGGLVGTPV